MYSLFPKRDSLRRILKGGDIKLHGKLIPILVTTTIPTLRPFMTRLLPTGFVLGV